MIDIIEKHGLKFKVDIERDDDMGKPWEEHDGHCEVIESRGTLSEPNFEHLGHNYYVDVRRTEKKAEAEGWGLNDEALEALTTELGREPTKAEAIERAIMRDFERLQGWLNDDWYWCGIVVTLLDINEDRLPVLDSLWGIESDSGDAYFEEQAYELANQIVSTHAIGENDKELKVRDTTYTIRR